MRTSDPREPLVPRLGAFTWPSLRHFFRTTPKALTRRVITVYGHSEPLTRSGERMAYIEFSANPLSRGKILRKLLRKGYRLRAVNPLAQYYETVEKSLRRLKKNPRARLSNQEAYTLAAAWRKHSYDGAWVQEYPFNSYDATTVERWYRRMNKQAANNLPARFKPLIDEYRALMRKYAGSDRAQRFSLAFKPEKYSDPMRRFSSYEALIRFLTLPHYKEARDRIAGAFALVKTNKKGRITKTLKTVKEK